MSPTLMERYLSAAQKISRLAVGTPPPLPNVDYFRIADDLQQDDHLQGTAVRHARRHAIRYTFPTRRRIRDSGQAGARSERERAALHRAAASRGEPRRRAASRCSRCPACSRRRREVSGAAGRQRRAVRHRRPDAARQAPIRGAPDRRHDRAQCPAAGCARATREKRNRADEKWDVRVRVKAGERDVDRGVPQEDVRAGRDAPSAVPAAVPGRRQHPRNAHGRALRSVEIGGPYSAATARGTPRAGDASSCAAPGSAGRRCRARHQRLETACATTILSTLARRAYRRPVDRRGHRAAAGAFTRGPAPGRIRGRHRAGPEAAAGQPGVPVPRRARPAEPAAEHRLPDQRSRAGLAAVVLPLEQHSRRRAARRRGEAAAAAIRPCWRGRCGGCWPIRASDALIKNFAGQWLYLRNLPLTGPAQSVFPDFDDNLRQALRRETELFFDSIVREDRNALELLRANYTFLNERLALHYGIPQRQGQPLPARHARTRTACAAACSARAAS